MLSAVIAALALAVAAAHATPDPFAQALALEQQGKPRAALVLLEGKDLPQAESDHRDRLRSLVTALDASVAYAAAGDYELAQAALEQPAKELQPVADRPLVALVHRRQARLAHAARRLTDAEAVAALDKADALAGDGSHSDAVAIYKSVADAPASSVSERLRSRARVGQLHEEAAAATQHSSRFAAIGSTLVTVAIWIVYAAIAAAAVALVYLLHRLLQRLPPRKGTTLSVDDLDAERAERTAKSYVLARQLLAEILGVGISGRGDDGLDEARDLDGSRVSAALPRLANAGLAKFDALVQDDTPVRIGPFSFSPRQIVYLVAPFLRRRAEAELVGSLVSDGKRVSLTIERFESGRGEPVKAWHVTAEGDDAHAKALSEMAARLATASGASTISGDWQSLLEYRTAMTDLEALPDADDRRKALEGVRDHLRRAIDHDQGNLLARFQLARVERQLGENQTAVEHFAFLDHLSRTARLGAGPIGAFLAAHPEMRYVARYNRAVTLSKIDDWVCHNDAVDLLLVLGMELTDAQGLDPEERRRLQMLTASAWADSFVFELEQLRDEDPGAVDSRSQSRRTKRRQEGMARIREIRAWLDELAEQEGVREDRAWVRSYATTQNALGRALYFAESYHEAIAAFESSIALTPDLADAYVNLGSALQRTKPKRWLRRAEIALRRGLELAPDNEKALFLLGRVLADPRVGQLDEARQLLARVTDNPWAAFKLAELDAEEGKFPSAAQNAMKSVRMSKRVDVRSAKLVEWTLRAAQSGTVSDVLLNAAVAAAHSLEREGDDRQRAQAVTSLERLNALSAQPPASAQAQATPDAPSPTAPPTPTPAPAAP